MNNKPHAHRLRNGRVSIGGQVYLLTLVTAQRQNIFSDFAAARCLVRVLQTDEQLGRSRTLAYVVMPDHLHWLMQLGDLVDLSHCVQSVKSMVTRQLEQPVWQAGFHDRAMRHEDDLPAIARYIIANPLRAGLAQGVGHYPHWDACWLNHNGSYL